MEVRDRWQLETDDLLLDRLGELAAIVDPMPWRIEVSACAAFARQAAKPLARSNRVRGQIERTIDDPGAPTSGPSEPSSD